MVRVVFDKHILVSVQFSSVAQSCPTLCNPMNCSTPGLPVHLQLPSSPKLKSIESVMPSSHLILCRLLLLLPTIPPCIRVFSNESILLMRWPKYWGFSFSIIPSKEIPGLKSWLKAQHHGIWSHHFMANRWGNSVRLYFWGLQNHCRW